jgi:hypothetical protein
MKKENQEVPGDMPEQDIEQKLRAAEEALRLQELDAAEALERIATLEAQVAKTARITEAANPTGNLPVFEANGKNYRFKVARLNFGNKNILTADQICEDEVLLLQLVENGSDAIEAV